MSARVLIVDDERGLRITMTEFLRSEGYDVDAAEDVARARTLIEERDHHVVVADIILPGDNGLTLLKTLGESHPDTTVIMITGEPSYETAAEAVRAGAFDYLPKPLSRDTICGIVAKAARVAELQRENRAHRENLEERVKARTTELESVNARLEASLRAQGQVEAALRQSEQKYRLLAENATDVIWLTDLELRYSYVSPACERLLGAPPEHYVGRSADEALTPAASAQAWRVLGEELTAEQQGGADPRRSRTLQVDQLRVDGAAVPVEVRVTFVRDDEGRPAGILGVSRDLSERRAAESERRALEEALRRSQKMEAMGRLAGGVAQDFNNLLSAILGYSTFLKESLPQDDPMRGDVVEIEKASLRAASLTRQLLAFSRRDVIQPEVLDLGEVVTSLEGRLREIAGGSIEIEVSRPRELPPVCVDRAHIEQVLVNVVTNARDAMPDGGRLTVETDALDGSLDEAIRSADMAPGRYVRLTVSDTGHGMSDEVLDHAFDPFFSTKPGGEGVGLGLSTVYGIVMQAGGDLRLRSDVDRGTSVHVFLPVTSPELEAARRRRWTAVGPTACETVLVAEDDPSVLRLTCRILRSTGYTVIPARNGADALRVAEGQEESIDLLLSDVIMPGMSGSELATRLVAAHPELRVLFMSGYADDVIARHGVLSDATVVLQKPFTMEQLVEAVHAAISGEPE